MDELLQKLLAFPKHPPPKTPISDNQYDEGIKGQIRMLEKMSPRSLLQSTAGGEKVLDVLNPAQNSVSYLYALNANCTAILKGQKTTDLDTIYDKIATFLETFDGRQIRYVGNELTQLIQTFLQITRGSLQVSRAIPGIVNAILRLDPSGSVLTSNHLTLVHLALESRVYDTVLPVLDKYILYFPCTSNISEPKHLCATDLSPNVYITPSSGLTGKLSYQQVLEYFLYSGMVYMALGRWESALESLESAITYPVKDSSMASKIMVEAYKKWVLVGVLLHGKPLLLPKATSNTAAKTFKILAKPYDTVAQMFETATASRLKAEVDFGRSIWQNDCNTGLLLHVLAAYQKFQIRNLSKVYTKIMIPEILNQTQSAETGSRLPSQQAVEQLVQSMINDGTLHATLSRPPGGPSILTFTPGGPSLSEGEMKKEMATATERIHTLTQQIKQTDRMLTHDKQYIQYVQKQRKSKNGPMHAASMEDPEWIVEDEALMSDLY